MIPRTAAKILEGIKEVRGEIPDDNKVVEEALIMAIRSVYAWESAIRDINAAIMSDNFCQETEMGLSLAEDIIRYHMHGLEDVVADYMEEVRNEDERRASNTSA